jgi:hypothetical protein
VRSPDDSRRELHEEADAWIVHGCRLAVTIDTPSRTVSVHRPAAEPETVTITMSADLGDVVEGFVLRVAEVFAP